MAECPQCHSSIEISESNYGTLFTCPACQAVYFVGWDGKPEAGNPAVENPPMWQEPVDISNEALVPPPAVQVDAKADFSDIVDFGNSVEPTGTMTYTVKIQGIEIADTRSKIREALTDSKFGWDVDTVIQQIQNGVLTLHDLSPAKAVVLINRIKFLPVEISWKQNVLS